MNVIKDIRLMGPFQIFINEIQMTNGSNLNRASVVLMCPPHSISYKHVILKWWFVHSHQLICTCIWDQKMARLTTLLQIYTGYYLQFINELFRRIWTMCSLLVHNKEAIMGVIMRRMWKNVSPQALIKVLILFPTIVVRYYLDFMMFA